MSKQSMDELLAAQPAPEPAITIVDHTPSLGTVDDFAPVVEPIAPQDAPITINLTPAPTTNVVMSDDATLDDAKLATLLGTDLADQKAAAEPEVEPKAAPVPDQPPNARLEAEQAAGRAALSRTR